MSYKSDEWALARRPSGGWVALGAPKDTNGQCYRVTWPLPLYVQEVVEEFGPQAAWDQPLFVGIIGAINQILQGISDVGEYTPEPPFDLAAWVEEYEGVQAS